MNCKKCSKQFDDSFKFCPFCGASAQTLRKQNKRQRLKWQGTIYKRDDLKSKPWVAKTPSIMIIEKGKVKRQRQTIGYFETKTAAADALDEFRRAPTTKLNITVEQIFKEWWNIKKNNIGEKQKDVYLQSYNKLQPIYNKKFKEMRTADMQTIINELSLKYSNSLMHKVKILLGQLYQYAMQNDIVNKNYSEFIVLPKSSSTVKDCFTDLDVQKIKTAAADGVPYADLILIMCYTGHRISEFLSLTQFDIIKNDDMMFLRGGNKTDAGKNKIVPVHPDIKKYVDNWIAKNGETIFCNSQGKQFGVKYFREKIYYKAIESIGLPKLSPHATRRTFSTRLAASGVREDEIIKMMGHTDYAVDVQNYINPEQKTLYNAICKML